MLERNLFYSIGLFVLRPIFKLLFFYKIKNANILPKEGSYIICANHLSLIDPVLLAFSQKRKIFFMAKQELFKNKIFAKIIRALGAFPVARASKQSKLAIQHASDLLTESKVVGIFIEGTRSKDGSLLRPKLGAARIAKLSNVPVLPVSISTKSGRKIRIFRKVTVNCGSLIYPQDLKQNSESDSEQKENLKIASDFIMNKIENLRKDVIWEHKIGGCCLKYVRMFGI